MRSLYVSVLIAASVTAGCRSANKAEASEESLVAQPLAATADQPALCGKSGVPDCPLQRWMKSTLQAYQRAGDHTRLARALGELAEHAPEGYDSWKSLALRGAQLAATNDDAALRQVCKDCHQAHRARYRSERRAAPTW